MIHYRIRGGNRIGGTFGVGGGKNAALPILAALVLSEGESIIYNCPHIADIDVSIEILRHLGFRIEFEENTLAVKGCDILSCELPAAMVARMRSSILFMGAMLARCGKATLTGPGGCQIGPRPIDLHLMGLRKMGAVITEEGEVLHAEAPDGLQGADIYLREASVGATENLILAAVTAKGETIIQNAAREPEIVDLARFLGAMGACIQGAGTSTVRITGVRRLCGTTHRIMPDRIVTGTYLLAAAMTGGDLTVKHCNPRDVRPITAPLQAMGCEIREGPDSLHLRAPRVLRARHLITEPHPGFPTDMQAPFVAALCTAKGTSVIEERIFESRSAHAAELIRMGADITLTTDERTFIIKGRRYLSAADTTARDLRGGIALILAALAAQGTSTVADPGYISRGYEKPALTLSNLGADIVQF